MRFPSFIRLPRHQKFHYEPRYYDPIKEDIEQRTNMLKKERSNNTNVQAGERISAHWKRSQKQAKQSSLRQIIIITILITTLVTYFYFGNMGIYIIMGIFALAYIIFKFNKLRS